MKMISSLTHQQRFLIVFLCVILVPVFIMALVIKSRVENTLLRQKEAYLLGFARMLDAELEPGGYRAILRGRRAENAAREEKIRLLNEELKALTDRISSLLPGIGVGYYSKELDAILTYGPSRDYQKMVGRSIAPDHSGRTVMRENREMARVGSMVRGDILNAMHPIVRDGEVIGYAWANELTTEIMESVSNVAHGVIAVLLLCFAASVLLLVFLSRHTLRAVDTIIKGARAMRNDLSYRFPDIPGELGQVAESINNMAESINAATGQTRRTAAMLRNVVDNVDAIIAVCDPLTKEIEYANEHMLRLKGKTSLKGHVCHEALFALSSPCEGCFIDRFLDKNDESTLSQKAMQQERRNAETNRVYFVRGNTLRWHDNRLMCMIAATDITERRALVQAEAANAAQKEFLSRMSHELRTPMNGVLGMTHLALEADPPPKQKRYLEKIRSSASLLLGIINDILDFSRIEAGKLDIETRVFNLHAAIRNIRELILPRTREKGVELVFTIDDSVPEFVVGDELRLSQILLNLLGNAAKFTSRGSIGLSGRAESDGIAVTLFFEVRDQGIGMTPEEQERLFKPFSQTNVSTSRKFGGTGLGLAISKTLVEFMNGRIRVESAPGEGSVFSFFVVFAVAAQDALPETTGTASAAERQRYDGHRFLLVEDNEINQEIARTLLTDLGATVDIAENGEEAVKAFLRQDYDLIFMDLRMPVMDGLEATEKIRGNGKHDAATVPIIAMTANAMREEVEQSLAAGMDGHIAKPIDVTAMKNIMFSCLVGAEHPAGRASPA
jgi:signal transduction histidine kinase/CheY-like chemotaxis protein